MARPTRINLAGGLFHIIQRGNNHQSIFFSDADRRMFLARLGRYAAECACRVHAYCLMSNHLHLLVETGRANLSVFGQRLFSAYTLWMNRTHHRVGHLFQGRFKSFVVEEDPYLLELSRYIHLNPVRAGIAGWPEAYRWSSMRAYLPGARRLAWVHTATTLGYFNGNRRHYVAFVHAGMAREEEPLAPIGQQVVGSETFAERLGVARGDQDPQGESLGQRAAGAPDRVLQEVSRLTRMPIETLRQRYVRQPHVREAKAVAAWALRQGTALTLRQIGHLLGGVSATAIGQYLRWADQRPQVQQQASACQLHILDA